MTSTDRFLEEAIQEARQGLREGGIPIGSVIVHGDTILGRGHNRRVQKLSAILHGEMDALENGGRQPASIYRECVHFVVRNSPRHRRREPHLRGRRRTPSLPRRVG